MRVIAPLFLAAGVTVLVVLPVHADDWPQFYRAIQQIETGGCKNPSQAVGDGGRSIGPYQIGKAYWIDSHVPGKWQDCRDQKYAERVMVRYFLRYCPRAIKAKNWQTLARVHNGGLRGHKKQATLEYWRKVQRCLAIPNK